MERINVTDNSTYWNKTLFDELQDNIEAADEQYLLLSGGTMTGEIVFVSGQQFYGEGVIINNPSYTHSGVYEDLLDHINDDLVHHTYEDFVSLQPYTANYQTGSVYLSGDAYCDTVYSSYLYGDGSNITGLPEAQSSTPTNIYGFGYTGISSTYARGDHSHRGVGCLLSTSGVTLESDYNDGTNFWGNITIGLDNSGTGYLTDITGSYIGELYDVDTTGEIDGDILQYDSGTGLWTATSLSISNDKVAIDSLATPDYIGSTSSTGVVRTSYPLTKIDGGNYITLGLGYTGNFKLTSNNIDTIQDITTSSTPSFAGLNLSGGIDSSIAPVNNLIKSDDANAYSLSTMYVNNILYIDTTIDSEVVNIGKSLSVLGNTIIDGGGFTFNTTGASKDFITYGTGISPRITFKIQASNTAIGIGTNLPKQPYGIHLDYDGSNGYGFITSSYNTYLSANSYYDGSWKYITANKSSNISLNRNGSIYFRVTDTTGMADGILSYSNVMAIQSTGLVGIGTTDPRYWLEVYSDDTDGIGVFNTAASGIDSGGVIRVICDDGSIIADDDRLGGFYYGGFNGSSYTYGCTLTSEADETWVNGSNYGTRFILSNILNGDTTLSVSMKIDGNGYPYFPLMQAGAVIGDSIRADADGQLMVFTSSRRYKEYIEDIEIDTSKVYDMRPVSFSPKNDINGLRQIGFIAEEVVELFPELVPIDKQGLPSGVNYEMITVLLVNELKKLRSNLQFLKDEYANIKTELDFIKTNKNNILRSDCEWTM